MKHKMYHCQRRSFLMPIAWMLVFSLMLGAAGCTVIPKPLPPITMLDKIVWPPPPMEARVAWVQAIATQADAGIRKGFWRRAVDAVFGEEQVRIVRPYGIHVDREKRIIVADTGGRVVHFIDSHSGRYELVPPQPSPPFSSGKRPRPVDPSQTPSPGIK